MLLALMATNAVTAVVAMEFVLVQAMVVLVQQDRNVQLVAV